MPWTPHESPAMTAAGSDNELAVLITELLNAQEAMVERIEALG